MDARAQFCSALPADEGPEIIVDARECCDFCGQLTSRRCPTCRVTFFCSDGCERSSLDCGHAAACRYHCAMVASPASFDAPDSVAWSGDGRVRARMLWPLPWPAKLGGVPRENVPCDVHFALRSLFNVFSFVSTTTSLGLVICDKGPSAAFGAYVSAMSIFNASGSEQERSATLLKRLAAVAGEMLAMGRVVGNDKWVDAWGHVFVLCTPIETKTVGGEEGHAYQVDVVQYVHVQGDQGSTPRLARKGDGRAVLSHSRCAPARKYVAGVIPVLKKRVVGDPLERDRFVIENPFNAHAPDGRPRRMSDAVIAAALGPAGGMCL